jgi:hypothetical protein
MVFMVSFSGPAKVGKSTTTKRVKEEIQKINPSIKVCEYAFASPLYEICSIITGVEVETLKSQSYKEVVWNEETSPIPSLIGWTPRKFLQIVGTECFRQNISQNFWVECARKRVENYDIALIGDARFENEFLGCNYNIELSREGITYACDHPSAMPPPKHLIHSRIILTPDVNYKDIAIDILG